MTQKKADAILMKNWTLICGKEYLCRIFLKKSMCPLSIITICDIVKEIRIADSGGVWDDQRGRGFTDGDGSADGGGRGG